MSISPSSPPAAKRRNFIGHSVCICFLLSALFFLGCRTLSPVSFRRPEDLSRSDVLDRIYEQSHFFYTLTDTGISLRVIHESESGRRRYPSVGGVLAFDRMLPGLWLRTEKFGQNVFTLRAHKNTFWLELPDSREIVTGGEIAYRRMPHLVRPEEILLWLAPPDWLGLTWEDTDIKTDGREYVFEVALDGFPLRQVRVDRYDLRITSITIYDIIGNTDTQVLMDRYQPLNGTEFPHRLTVRRPREGYEITLRLGSPRFDRELPEKTFLPRDRPGWRHIDLDASFQ